MDIKHLKKQLITNIRISKTKTLYDLYKNNEKIQAYITVKGIKFINPNAKAVCGCGESFTV